MEWLRNKRIRGILLIMLCAGMLVRIALMQGFSPQFLPRAFDAGVGLKSALPPHVFEALPMLYQQHLKNYSLSAAILRDEGSLKQRFIEASYPIRIEENSQAKLQLAGEDEPAGCVLLQKGTWVALYDCTH